MLSNGSQTHCSYMLFNGNIMGLRPTAAICCLMGASWVSVPLQQYGNIMGLRPTATICCDYMLFNGSIMGLRPTAAICCLMGASWVSVSESVVLTWGGGGGGGGAVAHPPEPDQICYNHHSTILIRPPLPRTIMLTNTWLLVHGGLLPAPLLVPYLAVGDPYLAIG